MADLSSIQATLDKMSSNFDALRKDVDDMKRGRSSRRRTRRTPSRSPARSRSPRHGGSSRRASHSRSREPHAHTMQSWASQMELEDGDEEDRVDSEDEIPAGDLVLKRHGDC